MTTKRTDAERAHLMQLTLQEVEQIAGKALGYPWYKDNQDVFPGATETDGVCTGEHVAETIVEELAEAYLEAKRIITFQRTLLQVGAADGYLTYLQGFLREIATSLAKRDNQLAEMTANRDQWERNSRAENARAGDVLVHIRRMEAKLEEAGKSMAIPSSKLLGWIMKNKPKKEEACSIPAQ